MGCKREPAPTGFAAFTDTELPKQNKTKRNKIYPGKSNLFFFPRAVRRQQEQKQIPVLKGKGIAQQQGIRTVSERLGNALIEDKAVSASATRGRKLSRRLRGVTGTEAAENPHDGSTSRAPSSALASPYPFLAASRESVPQTPATWRPGCGTENAAFGDRGEKPLPNASPGQAPFISSDPKRSSHAFVLLPYSIPDWRIALCAGRHRRAPVLGEKRAPSFFCAVIYRCAGAVIVNLELHPLTSGGREQPGPLLPRLRAAAPPARGRFSAHPRACPAARTRVGGARAHGRPGVAVLHSHGPGLPSVFPGTS